MKLRSSASFAGIVMCVGLGLGWPAAAQSGSIDMPSLAPTEVQISNTSSSTTLKFQVIGSNCNPLNVSLLPDHYGTYTCDGASFFNFVIVTAMKNGPPIRRAVSLQPSHRYEVFVGSDGAWNIRESAPR